MVSFKTTTLLGAAASAVLSSAIPTSSHITRRSSSSWGSTTSIGYGDFGLQAQTATDKDLTPSIQGWRIQQRSTSQPCVNDLILAAPDTASPITFYSDQGMVATHDVLDVTNTTAITLVVPDKLGEGETPTPNHLTLECEAFSMGFFENGDGSLGFGEGGFMACPASAVMDVDGAADDDDDTVVVSYKAKGQKTLDECVDISLMGI